MQTLETVTDISFPFDWVNLTSFRESDAKRVEIYLADSDKPVAGLIIMFTTLFSGIEHDILVYSKSWWGFCLDTWDIHADIYNYDLENKSIETQGYLAMLCEAEIPGNYEGVCKVKNWEMFLSTILPCITNQIAPYSPIFFSKHHNIFFYFHHTGSIGLYYRDEGNEMNKLLKIAEAKYDVIYN
ncbi:MULTISPECIES: hypothetical protein [unclassified Mucilaginibacter]|uniref:hypothetical protein n=1 Tax=unclassified Mucilaginibacter TaxID=2617802 RepID=UPI002AC94993|nr:MULTISPECIES: hypothetical protein [unclassified Mucilaginibacter]MEB0262201.1 hypothetical protein [Mucilaginibacter sp. 10I4]MEB0277061.1 hypothetical protein [Mucilaginibacter sp. 10B2]MEB0302191.1 hypothetical protein [Mucilaginibacter sp. 5C4]WPX25162.1 hypothetical protein RHM67_07765 [Mucilaginibacter sp. 5C4]